MISIAATIGVIAAAILLTAGYLLGARRGARARERLWQQGLDLAEGLRREQEDNAEQRAEMRSAMLKQDLGKLIELLLQQGDALQRMFEPLAQRVGEDKDLRATVEQVLKPLVQRERTGIELASVEPRTGHHHTDLTHLLDQIASKGRFQIVVLSDDQGLPLASSQNDWDLDRLGGISALLLVLADRIGREGGPAPLSLMLHDEENRVTLCRIFRFRDRRLLLTAVSTGSELTPSALDPALAVVDAVLAR